MTLDKMSKLVRWTYVLAHSVPRQTTLCRFFWRAFVFMPLFWAMAGGAVGAFVYESILSKGILPLLVVGVLAGVTGLVYILINVVPSIKDYVKESTFVAGIKAVKSKFCPIVEIK